MRAFDRIRGLVAGTEIDHLPVQPMIMMFAAKHLGILHRIHERWHEDG